MVRADERPASSRAVGQPKLRAQRLKALHGWLTCGSMMSGKSCRVTSDEKKPLSITRRGAEPQRVRRLCQGQCRQTVLRTRRCWLAEPADWGNVQIARRVARARAGAVSGAGPVMADLISGQVVMGMVALPSQSLEFHRSGKLRILAVTSP